MNSYFLQILAGRWQVRDMHVNICKFHEILRKQKILEILQDFASRKIDEKRIDGASRLKYNLYASNAINVTG